jgi:hypothetical protein
MDSQIERDWDPGHGRGSDQLGIAEQGGRAVMVAVEEGCDDS